MRDENASKQLNLISELRRLLSNARVEYWLAGGWGIDFALGKVTRSHGDIDIAVWKSDWPRIEALLLEHDFSKQKNQFPDETGRLLKDACKLEFYLLQTRNDGKIVVGGRWADWPFSDGTFDGSTGVLDGIECPVLGLHGQLSSKEQWSAQENGGPLREKDAQDIEVIRHYLSGK